MSIIDRREEYREKSSGSRQRFIKRYKASIKDAIDRSVKDGKGFTDLVGGSENKRKAIKIRGGINEPVFTHGVGGEGELVVVGNKEFTVGDQIPKPRAGSGRPRNGSPDGDGQDDFAFFLNREEFIDLILEDLELPDLVKKNLLQASVRELVHAGFSKSGAPGNLDIVRTIKNSIGRRIGLHWKDLQDELRVLRSDLETAQGADPVDQDAVDGLEEKISALLAKLRTVPFIDDIDVRYRHREWENRPTVSAVMFCLMDTSGSMGDHEKTIAKMFFFLLYLFLQRNYKNVQVIFIRHTHEAKECDEQEFFHSPESGGTVVSTALDLCHKIIRERFDPAVWNVYIAQASDGDNWDHDTPECREILVNRLLPLVQYMVYVQIDHDWADLVYRQGLNASQPVNSLWQLYQEIKGAHPHFETRVIGAKADIYPVFRKLFEKKK